MTLLRKKKVTASTPRRKLIRVTENDPKYGSGR